MMATVPLPTTADAPGSFARTLPPLLALALATALGFTMLGSFQTVAEAAKLELGLNDYQLSLVQGVAAAVPLVLLSVPIGIAVDRVHRVRLMIILSLVWTLGTFLTALANGFAALFVARMLTSIGMTGALTAALSLSADYCLPAQRGRAALIVNLGKTLGQAGGFALTGAFFAWLASGAGWFGDATAWRGEHYALAIVSAALTLPLLFLREPARLEVEAAPGAPFAVVWRELWARRGFLGPLFLGQVSVVMADAAAGVWIGPVLGRRFGLEPGEFGGWVGLLLLVSGLLGSVLGGLSADLGQKSARRGALLLGAVVAAGIAVPAALFPIAPGVTSFGILLGVLMLAGMITGLIMSVALTVWLPNELRGLTIGAFIAFAGLIGFGAAPTLVALASDILGGESHLPEALALVGALTSTLGFVGFWLAMRRAPVR